MPQWFGLAPTTSRFLGFLVKFSLVFDVRIKNGYDWAIKGCEQGHSRPREHQFFPLIGKVQTGPQVGLLLKMANGCVCCRRYR